MRPFNEVAIYFHEIRGSVSDAALETAVVIPSAISCWISARVVPSQDPKD